MASRPWAAAIDYRVYRAAAGIGLRDGWSRIYDTGLQRAAIMPLWPRVGWPGWWHGAGAFWTPFVSPPPLAWFAAPFNAVPEQVAAALWIALMTITLLVSVWILAERSWTSRIGYALLLVLTWATAIVLVSGNVVPLVGLGVVLAWRLSESQRPVLAGAVLGLTSFKPQLLLAMPIVLLAAGVWRTLLSWVVTAGMLALLSLLSLGSHGLAAYMSLARFVSGFTAEQELSLAHVTGRAPADLVIVLAVLAVVAVIAWRGRRGHLALIFGIGLLASLAVSPYLNLEDFALLPLSAMFWLRAGVSTVTSVLAVGLALSATTASQGFVAPTLVVGAALVAAGAAWPRPQAGARRRTANAGAALP